MRCTPMTFPLFFAFLYQDYFCSVVSCVKNLKIQRLGRACSRHLCLQRQPLLSSQPEHKDEPDVQGHWIDLNVFSAGI